jgi:hypothetical protein
VEFTSGMSPTSDLAVGAVAGEMMGSSVGIGLQRLPEALQMPARMFSLTIFRVVEPHTRSGLGQSLRTYAGGLAVLVLPLPRASAGTGVSSALAAPTHPARVVRPRSTPSRA